MIETVVRVFGWMVLLTPITWMLAWSLWLHLKERRADLEIQHQRRLREIAIEAVKALEEEGRRWQMDGLVLSGAEKKARAMALVQERGKTDIVTAKLKVDAVLAELRLAPPRPWPGSSRPS